jgi:hypothetical protein
LKFEIRSLILARPHAKDHATVRNTSVACLPHQPPIGSFETFFF